ncbi:MAG TPA: type II toxin-antitoxin system RatA family toxin [Steroidobacteraceae bacterium]|jgi:ribosome-associated toxin RatA of RatAB toxin-antitoxin module|nr:type II toxin-antitoxin system RatA family toxin [Steroidobacteraceae bacterium]
MREIKRSALVAQPPSRLFALINDIESYPRFLPWCTHARVLSRTEREIVAAIGVKRGPLHGEFTTRNELEPDRQILMHLVDGPFKMLEGQWLLTPIGPDGCRVELSMRFAFKNTLSAMMFEGQFAETIGSLVEAFVTRSRIPSAPAPQGSSAGP